MTWAFMFLITKVGKKRELNSARLNDICFNQALYSRKIETGYYL